MNVFVNNQYGFRVAYSTEQAVAVLLLTLNYCFNTYYRVSTVFFDVKSLCSFLIQRRKGHTREVIRKKNISLRLSIRN